MEYGQENTREKYRNEIAGEEMNMGMTLAEKILSSHTGRDVKAGEFVLANIDGMMTHDINRPLALEVFQQMQGERLFDPSKVYMMLGHHFPAPDEASAIAHQKMRRFCEEQGNILYEGLGIEHVVMTERGFALPGELVIGTDSHTCTYGALGVFSTGVGSADMGVAMITGKLWFLVPETIRLKLNGSLPPGVFPKDLILYLVATLTADGATYKAVEFAGPVVEEMSMDGRFTLCNMAVEMGAKAGLIVPDETTLEWVKGRATREYTPQVPDPSADYSKVMEFDVSDLAPYVAKPHQVDNGVPIEELVGTPINQANLVSCNAARIEDLRVAASLLKGLKIAPGVRMLVVPPSREVLKAALVKGLIETFIDAGCHMGSPNCGGCADTMFGTPSDGDVVISTANRNFKGRLGNPRASIYLASPATVAASALEGRIVDPRPYFRD
jgi:3-isopropylmalate/(R)-2-methylmalate dehydratase large subunit